MTVMDEGSNASILIGTWKQLSGTIEDVGSGVERNTYSAGSKGYVNFSADGRLMLLCVDPGRKKPAGEVPSAAEAEALFRGLIAYAGNYTLDGNRVTYDLDVTWNETWTGRKQVRFWEVKGDRLIISTPEMVNPQTGKRSVMRLTFQKFAGRS